MQDITPHPGRPTIYDIADSDYLPFRPFTQVFSQKWDRKVDFATVGLSNNVRIQ